MITMTRLRRMEKENGWRSLGDIRPDTFVKWRAGLTCSAKTKKEYQISAGAFLNWLVKTERLLLNPLATLPLVPQDLADPRRPVRDQSARSPRSPRPFGRQPDRQGLHRCSGSSPP